MKLRLSYAVSLLFFLIFLIVYKLTVWHLFSGPELITGDCVTHYGGIKTGELSEFIQTKEETCGYAALAFFLTNIGIPETESSLIRQIGTDSMLSLADLEKVFIDNGFKTQALKVEPSYFRKHTETAILHFSEKHFVVFLWEENGEPMIFDPAYGQVYVSWNIFYRLFSGYMLYVYTG
jgi:ABC-type bacteriocin/lantibiotic exporter with double-glycine peptidase domain